MARIPRGEGLGEVVARGGGMRDAAGSEAAYGGALAQAVEGTGEQLVAQERREAARQAEEIERARLLRVQADKATALQRMQSGEQDLVDVADDVATRVASGALDKTRADDEWRALAQSRMDDTLATVPVEHRQLAQSQLELRMRRLSSTVREGVARRDRDDTRAGLLSYLESQERFAVTDPKRATEAATAALASLGPAAGYGADDLEKLSWGFRERVAGNRGQALVRGASEDMKGLDAAMKKLDSDEFADLTPERRGQLENQILARKGYLEQKEQTRIARAEAAAARRAREAEASLKATQTIIDSGGIPSPQYLDQVSARTAGTAYAPALRELLVQATERAGFATLSPQQQEAKILEARAQATKNGTTPANEARIASWEKLASESRTQLEDDPLLYGVNRRLIDEVRPIDLSSLDQLGPQLVARADQAATISARVGRPVSPLLKSEAKTVERMLSMLPVAQQNVAVRQIANTLDARQAQALAKQLGGKESVLGEAMFLAANAKRAPRDPAELILNGADAKKSGRLKDASADAVTSEQHRRIAEELSAVPWATTQARDAAISAAQGVYDGLRAEGRRDWRQAVDLATGGLTEWAGSKVPIPYGMTPRQFRQRMQRLDSKAVQLQAGGDQVFIGGQAMSVDKLVSNMGAVKLIPAGVGSYALESGGQLVMTGNKVPLRIAVED
ncbi:hypothetical protein [Hydrogenophaga sp. BPS33]|uniref:hypothetical protein n=1 Tax=Hydrogenophaga sp. BPS33 TaxID=2651974 RepID=UPI00131F8D73|nr:hypothetical protein [Hydrogenophaga sp. BPS33]QHE86311.1 hypothetical protein F9K07_16070 [Hydrogenophaga sp. BPS33]